MRRLAQVLFFAVVFGCMSLSFGTLTLAAAPAPAKYTAMLPVRATAATSSSTTTPAAIYAPVPTTPSSAPTVLPQAPRNGVDIATDTCYLQVVGEKSAAKYTLRQGVRISPAERLALICQVVSHESAAVSLTPVYETRQGTTSGEVAAQKGGDTGAFTLATGAKKMVTLALPWATRPQYYVVVVLLKTSSGVSNPAVVSYTLEGPSATIQSIALDHDSYKKDALAKVSFVWSWSDMNASTSKLTTLTSMTGRGGVLCSLPISRPLELHAERSSALLMAQDCQDPLVELDIKDASGTVLAHQVLVTKSKRGFALTSGLMVLTFLTLVFCAIFAAVVFYMKKHHA